LSRKKWYNPFTAYLKETESGTWKDEEDIQKGIKNMK
jgi:hypothetical protein